MTVASPILNDSRLPPGLVRAVIDRARAGDDLEIAAAALAHYCGVEGIECPSPEDIAQEATEAAATIDKAREISDAWPIPKPLPADLLPVRTFDYELLPPSLRGWIQDAAERLQAPPDYLAVAAMVAAGSVIGRRIAIRPKRKDTWTEFGNLWGMIVGGPGTAKSPSITDGTSHLRRFVATARKTYEQELAQFDAITGELKQREKAAKKTDAVVVGKPPPKPIHRRFIVNGSTVEALHDLCRENPQGLLVLHDELSGLLRDLEREERASDRSFYLQSWAGNEIVTLDRILRGKDLWARVNLSLLGGAQPDRIAGFVRSVVRGGASNDGLLQRFGLTVWPDHSGEWRNVDRWRDSEAREAAGAAFDRLRDLDPFAIGAELDKYDGDDGVPFLRFDSGAQDAFFDWLTELMREINGDTLHPAMSAHLSKYRKLVPSLALGIHLIDGGTGPVSEAALLRALAWAEYLRTHAERMYGCGTAREISCARLILGKLRAGAIEYTDSARRSFDARTICRKHWTGLDREGTAAGLELLADLDYLRPEITQTGGRPAVAWIVNPEALR